MHCHTQPSVVTIVCAAQTVNISRLLLLSFLFQKRQEQQQGASRVSVTVITVKYETRTGKIELSIHGMFVVIVTCLWVYSFYVAPNCLYIAWGPVP